MAQRNAPGLPGPAKKDRQAVQRLRDEIDQETANSTVRAQQRDPNRDAARGDRDRSSRHFDEDSARDDRRDQAPDGPPPDEQYRGQDREPD